MNDIAKLDYFAGQIASGLFAKGLLTKDNRLDVAFEVWTEVIFNYAQIMVEKSNGRQAKQEAAEFIPVKVMTDLKAEMRDLLVEYRKAIEPHLEIKQFNQSFPKVDQVNHPQHYTSGAIECIDAMESALGHEQFIGFLRGQVIKYTWRLGKKDGARVDAEKAEWYAKKLAEVLGEKC